METVYIVTGTQDNGFLKKTEVVKVFKTIKKAKDYIKIKNNKDWLTHSYKIKELVIE